MDILKLENNLKEKTLSSIQSPDGLVETKGNDKILTLSIGDTLLSGMMIDKNDHPFPAITFIYSNPEFRNKGYMKKLLKEYTKMFGKLMTDNTHSSDAENMWRSLIARSTNELKIEVINTSTNKISKINDKNNSWSIDPWDDDTGDIRLVFENNEIKAFEIIKDKPLFSLDGGLGIILENNI